MWHKSHLHGNRSEWDKISPLRGNNGECSHRLNISSEALRKEPRGHHLKGPFRKEARGHHLKGTVQKGSKRSPFKGTVQKGSNRSPFKGTVQKGSKRSPFKGNRSERKQEVTI